MVIVSRMTPEEARTLAERLYAGRLDRYGSPLVGHVRRVTAEVPVEACAVAWLHEALEYAVATAEELCPQARPRRRSARLDCSPGISGVAKPPTSRTSREERVRLMSTASWPGA